MKIKNKFPLIFTVFAPALLILIATIAVSIFIYQNEFENELRVTKIREADRTNLIGENVNILFDFLIEDILILSEQRNFKNLLEDQTISRQSIEEDFFNISAIRKVYDQIRYLDETGQEVVRVNYNSGDIAIVPEDQLQNKEQRYYFQSTSILDKGEIFVSPFDLNVENEQIEQPIKPMIRIGTPVFNQQGDRKGVLVFNYLGANILDSIKENEEQNDSLFMLNQDGYWLKSDNPDQEWGFMYPDKMHLTMSQSDPKLWQKIKDTDQGQIEFSGGVYTVKTIYPFIRTQASCTGTQSDYSPNLESLDPGEYCWKIVSFVPFDIINKTIFRLKVYLIILNSITFLVLFSGATVIYKSLQKELRSKEKIDDLNKILEITNKILRHDLANIFTSISYACNFYLESKDKQMLAEAISKSQQGIDLIKQIKEVDSLTSTEQGLKMMSLKKIIEEIKNDYQIPIKLTGSAVIKVDFAIKPVLKNLIDNAIDHGKTKKIDIKVKRKMKHVEIDVIDYGTGVPDEIKDRIFENGFKYGETGNTGLGLYIVEQTIDRYGGKITVADNQPKGAIFKIILPK